ncbi:hypothetical protein E3P99_00569 [Wallemia hederae]|uniref:Condensation domain-containing protein n=1 Tax=Wallemia hederae TaxID=1540922 RepID=A0A4T0FUZ5_9BASI|nr:hypothetical protein E3P99_00569 [Wallemia hederae]
MDSSPSILASQPPSLSSSLCHQFMDTQLLLGLAHLSPSPLQWNAISNGVISRPFGLVELFFYKMSTIHHGRTDIFYRLPFKCSTPGILQKLPIAWAKLHQRHPSLSFNIVDNQFTLDLNTLSTDPVSLLTHSSTSLVYHTDYNHDVVTWMREHLWNGDRKYLSDTQLARLFVFHNPKSNQVDIVLAIAHCISDGTSVVALMNEFLELLTSDEVARVSARVDVPNLSNYNTFKPQVHVESNDSLSFLHADRQDILAALPMAAESGYPPLPATVTPPSVPRLRWYWAIRRVVSQVRSEALNRLTTLEFIGENAPQTQKELEPSWGALTDWKQETLSAQQTAVVMAYSRACGVKIGSLLFAASTIAISNLNHKHADKSFGGDTCIVGFPFSLRPYLSPRRERSTPSVISGTADVSPMSVQLGFGGIQLPSTPCYADSPTFKNRFAYRAQSARRQFDKLLSSPTLLQDGHLMALSRASNFSKGDDGWKSIKQDQSQEKKRGKGTAINASMIGAMDRVIKREYSSVNGAVSLDSSRTAYIGVRCRQHELLLETFTLNGQLTITLGHDKVMWNDECVREYLQEFRRILEALAM